MKIKQYLAGAAAFALAITTATAFSTAEVERAEYWNEANQQCEIQNDVPCNPTAGALCEINIAGQGPTQMNVEGSGCDQPLFFD